MSLKILAAQLPWYNHDTQRLPTYFDEWNERYRAGEDMRVTYGNKAMQAA